MMTTKERNDHSEEMEKAPSDCSYRNRCRDNRRNCVCKNANLCSDRGRAAGDGTGRRRQGLAVFSFLGQIEDDNHFLSRGLSRSRKL